MSYFLADFQESIVTAIGKHTAYADVSYISATLSDWKNDLLLELGEAIADNVHDDDAETEHAQGRAIEAVLDDADNVPNDYEVTVPWTPALSIFTAHASECLTAQENSDVYSFARSSDLSDAVENAAGAFVLERSTDIWADVLKACRALL